MSRGAIPAPEDHLTEQNDYLEGRSGSDNVRDMAGVPRDGQDSDKGSRMNRWATRDGEDGSVESGEPVGNGVDMDAFGLASGVTRNQMIHARDNPGDDTAASYEDTLAAESTASRPARSTFGGPLASPFGGPLVSPFPRPEGLTSDSSRTTAHRGTLPARNSESGWFNPFSPHARRTTEQLSSSSEHAVHNPDAVIQSIGTQRLMPSRDPMAPFHAEPRPKGRAVAPARSASPDIERNKELVKRSIGRPKEPWLNKRRSSFVPRDPAEVEEWYKWKAADDLTKQRDDDLKKGLTTLPRPFRPWVKPSLAPPTAEQKELIPPAMRRQFDAWQEAYDEEQRVEREGKRLEREKEREGKRLEREKKRLERHGPEAEGIMGRLTRRQSGSRLFSAMAPPASMPPPSNMPPRRLLPSSMPPPPSIAPPSSMPPPSLPSSSMPPPRQRPAGRQPAEQDADDSSTVSSPTAQARARRTAWLNTEYDARTGTGPEPTFPWAHCS
jgi:hypothetical protein